jgi:hypothetical protein
MKSIIKLSKIVAAVALLWGTVACEKEDFLIFTAITNDTLSIQNEVQSVYKLSNATSSNIAERLVWNTPDFDAPTTVTYVVELSSDAGFSTVNFNSGDTSNTHFGISVANLIEIATTLGLDEDPNTTAADGEANNAGIIYARVKAFAGSSSSGANGALLTSETARMNIEMIEAAGSCAESILTTWGLVGSAVNNWGGDNRGFAAGNDVPFLSNGTEGLFHTTLHMVDGEFKIRQDNDWGVNYGDTGADGTLELGGDNMAITAGNYYVEFNENDLTITVTAADPVWGIVGNATLNGWGDAPDVKMSPDPCNDDVYLVYGVTLADGEMKFRADDDWGVNYGDTGADGTLDLGGDNIAVSAGTYNIMLDIVNNTYSIEAQ